VLDLCTGSGIQALQVAGRAAGVVAVDIGARAVAMARCNALLNDARGVEVRQGDLYRPVRGERYDLIIANPPFVPARTRGPAYHSGGPRGDRVLRRVVKGWGAHLRPGGRAVAISHLAVRRSETVAGILRPWVRGFGGRVLALVLESGTPVDLAAAQSLFALDDGFAAYGREVRGWTAYLRRQRVEQVVLLLLAAERGGRTALEVNDAFQRTLPLPLSQPPPVLVAQWLERGPAS
jgi:methylase of polypeptide subunit release factors